MMLQGSKGPLALMWQPSQSSGRHRLPWTEKSTLWRPIQMFSEGPWTFRWQTSNPKDQVVVQGRESPSYLASYSEVL